VVNDRIRNARDGDVTVTNRPEFEYIVAGGDVVKLPEDLFEESKYLIGGSFGAPFCES